MSTLVKYLRNPPLKVTVNNMFIPPQEPLLEVLSSAPLAVNPICSLGRVDIAEDLFATRKVALSKPA